MARSWMVRAERNGRLFDAFKEKSVVAVGWPAVGDLSTAKTRKAIADALARVYPGAKAQSQAMAAGQLHRFVNELSPGDAVVTYDPSRRVYLVGEISGPYQYDPAVDPEDPHVRAVKWQGEVARDLLSADCRNSLGSISTLFRLSAQVMGELTAALSGVATPQQARSIPEETAEEDPFESMAAQAHEVIKDRVSGLTWEQMQDLVAGVLRSLGYKTRVSAAGADRGKDIEASPDGFGFEAPRIIVEVKHRPNTSMSAPEIRSFLAGRHPDDKGLYVSTGGFTREARYEAERARIPTALMDLDELVTVLLDQYDKLDIETRQLVPLKRIFIPA